MNDHNPFAEKVPLETLPTTRAPRPESSDFGVPVSIPAVGARRPIHEDDERWSPLAIDETPLVPAVKESGGPPKRGGSVNGSGNKVSLTSVLLVVIPMAVIIVVVALVVAGLDNSQRRGGSAGSRATAAGQPGQGNSAATPGCVDQHDGAVVTGAGPGGQSSGPDAILWFQHSYYVERSAIRARQVVAPTAAVTAVDEIQRGIESVPLGTEYCLRITALGDGQYRVELTEQRPGEQPTTFTQQVTTATQDRNTVITGIAPA